MAHKEWIFALSLVVGTPAFASQPAPNPMPMAPQGTPDTRYCMRIEAVTGTRLETVKCWTREEWAEQGVDVDKDWAKEGVAVLQG